MLEVTNPIKLLLRRWQEVVLWRRGDCLILCVLPIKLDMLNKALSVTKSILASGNIVYFSEKVKGKTARMLFWFNCPSPPSRLPTNCPWPEVWEGLAAVKYFQSPSESRGPALASQLSETSYLEFLQQ